MKARAAAAIAFLFCGYAHAQAPATTAAWPAKPIRVLVGAPAGGNILVRLVGAKLALKESGYKLE